MLIFLRATFPTWVDDTRPAEREAAEKALAHEVVNKVSRAWRRSDLFDRCEPLLREWAEHCGSGAKRDASAPGSVPGQPADQVRTLASPSLPAALGAAVNFSPTSNPRIQRRTAG